MTEARSEKQTIHVGNLSLSTGEDKLREYFGQFGEILEFRPARTPTGQSRGFAFIDYASSEIADRAVSEGNNHEIDGNHLLVQIARRKFGETSLRRDAPRYDDRRRRDDYYDERPRYDDYYGRRYDDPPRRYRDPSPPYRRSRYDRDDYGSRRD
jgi:RNA recognition motif-containing protein